MTQRPELIVRVFAYPSSKTLSLTPEIELLKPAIIYADRVVLSSMAATMVGSLAALHSGTPAERQGALLSMMEAISADDAAKIRACVAERDELLMSSRQVRRRNKTKIEDIDDLLREMEEGLFSTVEGVLEQANAEPLASAMAEGVVEIDPLLFSEDDDFVSNLIEALAGAFHDPTSFAIVDSGIAELVQVMVREGAAIPSPSAERHAREVGVGTGVLARLPTFGSASLDDVLRIRDDLTQYVQSFRAVASGFGDHVALPAYDAEFQHAVDDVVRLHVQPALEEMREGFSTSRAARRAFGDALALTEAWEGMTSAAAVALCLAGLDAPGPVVAAGSIAAPALAQTSRTIRSTISRRADLRKHGLFLAYEADRRLS